jgi:hypothetical protein
MLGPWLAWLAQTGPAGIRSAMMSGTTLGLSLLDVLWNRGQYVNPDPFLILPNLACFLKFPLMTQVEKIAESWILNVRQCLLQLVGTIIRTRKIPDQHDLLEPNVKLWEWMPRQRIWIPKTATSHLWPYTAQPYYLTYAEWTGNHVQKKTNPTIKPKTRLDTRLPDGRTVTRQLPCDQTGDIPTFEWDAQEGTWFAAAYWNGHQYLSHDYEE